MVAHNPLHGSGRAVLLHPALALGNNAKLDVSAQARWTCPPGSGSGTRYARASSHWPIPFPPSPPGPAQARPRSATSLVLWNCPTSRLRASSVCVLGLSDAVCFLCSHRRIRDLPVSAQGACMHAQGLRPRRVQKRLALTTLAVLPSAPFNSVGTQKWPPLARWGSISRLNTSPAPTPVNASLAPLPTKVHDSEPVWIATPSLYETFIHNTLPAFTGASKRFERLELGSSYVRKAMERFQRLERAPFLCRSRDKRARVRICVILLVCILYPELPCRKGACLLYFLNRLCQQKGVRNRKSA